MDYSRQAICASVANPNRPQVAQFADHYQETGDLLDSIDAGCPCDLATFDKLIELDYALFGRLRDLGVPARLLGAA